ncbi:hypothetical protein LWX53_02175 [bacterium]|nr:hypothetical protein [bacterium]
MRRAGILVAVCLAAAAIASCATKLPSIPEGASSAEIIQMAQNRSDLNDWKGAQHYYKALLEKFPNDPALTVAAMYELAFIEYKQEHWEAARAGLKAVLDKYAAPEGASLPQTWKILAEKVLAKLPKQAQAPTASPAAATVPAAAASTTTTLPAAK